jgi:hypothetical protein
MKKIYLFLVFSMFVGTFASSCSKEEDEDVVVVATTGDMVVNAKDALGSALDGKTIEIFTSEDNYINGVVFKSATCDANGQVKFLGLSPQKYWVYFEYTSLLGNIVTANETTTITAGNVNTITLQP